MTPAPSEPQANSVTSSPGPEGEPEGEAVAWTRSAAPANALALWALRARQLTARPVVAWLGAVLVALVAFLVRITRLGEPDSFAFDETYYAKHAWSLLERGYAMQAKEGVDPRILDGDLSDLWTGVPEMVVHPEVGKWLIAAGEWALGMDPAGWRIASAVIGSLMILLMCRFTTRLTGSVALGWLGGLLLSLDGLQLVMSRLALLDIFLAFFLLGGVHCIVADRQWFNRRMAAAPDPRDSGGVASWGPRLLWRPWLVAAGVWFGLAVGTKWTALYPLAAFGLWLWFANARARAHRGNRLAIPRSALTDGLASAAQLVGVAFVVYVLSWTGWLMNADKYEESLSNTQYTAHAQGQQWPSAAEPDAEGFGEVTQSLRSLLSYHRDVFAFHTDFLNDSTHTYASKPIGWLVMNRPVGVDAQLDIAPGDQGCEATAGSTCMRQVLLLGNPVIWWGGCAALLACAVLAFSRRDWRFTVPVLGVAAAWLPWLRYDDRTIFLFYAVAFVPFVVLALVMCLGAALGERPTAQEPARVTGRRTAAAVIGGAFVLVALWAFAFFWPIWTDELITHEEWLRRMWFDAWI